MKRAFKILSAATSFIYPVFILVNFFWFRLNTRIMIIGLALVGGFYFLAHSEDSLRRGFLCLSLWMVISSIAGLIAVTLLASTPRLLNFYPAFINIIFFISFGYTWIKGPPMIYRLALLKDKTIASSDQDSIMRCCRIITSIWSTFFFQNTIISLAIAFWSKEAVWSIYNGVVFYILIGALLGGEMLYRKLILRR